MGKDPIDPAYPCRGVFNQNAPTFLFWRGKSMKRYTTVELRQLEIVNSCDGAKFGCPTDFEFEAEGDCTRITALIVGGSGFLGIGGREEVRIPWNCVQCIGEDIILVRMNQEAHCRDCECRPKPRFWRK